VNFPGKMLDCLKYEGVVAIATLGPEGPHMVNTWNTYLQVPAEGRLLIPVGGMNRTEANLAADPRILITLGSREVPGRHGPGTGFLIRGTGRIVTSGDEFETVKAKFGWARAALAVEAASAMQTL
jgi:hypothetical protein